MATEFKSACCYMVPARIVKELVPPALAQKLKEPRPSTSGEASSAGPRWPKTEQPEGTGIRPDEIIIPAGAEDDVELMRQLYSTL